MPGRVGAVEAHHRVRLEELLRATGVFSESERAVALELFDEGVSGTVQTGGSGSDTSYHLIGWFENDQMVGYACYGLSPATDATYDLYWIAVDPAFHGRGVGASLLHTIESRLSEKGDALVVIETSSRREYDGTRRFYERRGYEQAARVRGFYSAGDDRLTYIKRIPQATGATGGSST